MVKKGRKRGFEHEFGLFTVVFVLALEDDVATEIDVDGIGCCLRGAERVSGRGEAGGAS